MTPQDAPGEVEFQANARAWLELHAPELPGFAEGAGSHEVRALSEVAWLDSGVAALVGLTQDRGATALQRDSLARVWIDLQAVRDLATDLVAWDGARSPAPTGDWALIELATREAERQVTSLALELLGPEAGLGAGNAPYGGLWQERRSRVMHSTETSRLVTVRKHVLDVAHERDENGHELRRRARTLLASNPTPSWRELAEQGWTAMKLPGEPREQGLELVEIGILLEELSRELAPSPLASTAALLPALPGADRAQVARGESSWVLALGSLVQNLELVSDVAMVGGDGIYALVGAERILLETTDTTRSLGVVQGGEAGRLLAPSSLLAAVRARALVGLAFEACGVGGRALEQALARPRGDARFTQRDTAALASTNAALTLARALSMRAATALDGGWNETRITSSAAKSAAGDAALDACALALDLLPADEEAESRRLGRLQTRALGIQSWESSGERLRSDIADFVLAGATQ